MDKKVLIYKEFKKREIFKISDVLSFFITRMYSKDNESFNYTGLRKHGVRRLYSGEVIIEPEFKMILNLNDSVIAVHNENQKSGVFDYNAINKFYLSIRY